MTKKRMEMLLGVDGPPQKAPSTSVSTGPGHTQVSKVVKPKEPSRTLKKLEALHEQTHVQENLQLRPGSRIRLQSEIGGGRTSAKRKLKPNFDIDFAKLTDTSCEHGLELPTNASDSGDDLPDAQDLLEPIRSERHASASDSTDYASTEFDALIANLPLTEATDDSAKLSGVSSAQCISPTLSRKRKLSPEEPPHLAKRGRNDQRLHKVRAQRLVGEGDCCLLCHVVLL